MARLSETIGHNIGYNLVKRWTQGRDKLHQRFDIIIFFASLVIMFEFFEGIDGWRGYRNGMLLILGYALLIAIFSFIHLSRRIEGTLSKKWTILVYSIKSCIINFFVHTILCIAAGTLIGRLSHAVLGGFDLIVYILVAVAYSVFAVSRFKVILQKGAAWVEERYSAVQNNDMELFLDTAQNEHGLPAVTQTIFQGFKTYSLAAEAQSTPGSWYYYGKDNLEAFRGSEPAPTKQVVNDARSAAIQEIIQNVTSEPFGVVEQDYYDNIDLLNKYVISGQPFPSLRFSGLERFVQARKSEMEALYTHRLKEYIGDYNIIQTGLKGEAAVQEVLNLHGNALMAVHNVRLEFPNANGKVESVETDTIVLTPGGIFAIEVKNYGSSGKYKIVVGGDGQWYKEYPARRKGEESRRENMANPFAQNDRHIAYLENMVNELLDRDMMTRVHIHNIIVLANDNVELVSEPAAKQTLTRVGTLYNQIAQYTTQILTMQEITKIKETLEARNLPPKAYPVYDYTEEMQGLMRAYQALYQYACTASNAIEECCKVMPDTIVNNLPQ